MTDIKRGRLRLFRLLCCMVYFASYMTRINYAAAILAVCEDLQLTRTAAGAAVTGCFFTYGIGQLISGLLGDRIPAKRLICIGLCGAACCNLTMPLLDAAVPMAAVWCCNGFFQSLLWPPLVKIMAENLDEKSYADTCVEVSAAASIATIATYLLVPLFLSLWGWRTAFYAPAALALSTALLWMLALPRLELREPKVSLKRKNTNQTSAPLLPLLRQSGVWLLMPAIMLHGLLREGITTWLPSCVAELGGLDTASSILSAVVLPVFSILSVWAASQLYRIIRGETAEAALLFGVGMLGALAMLLLLNTGAAALVLLMALITGCMHGVNLMLISRMPACFARYGCAASMSGLLNACTYLGSAGSTYGVATLSERFGWPPTILVWAAASAAGGLLCLAAHKKWMRFRNGQKT